MSVLAFREGRSSDLRATFELGELTWDASRVERNLLPADHSRPAGELEAQWRRERALLEFIEAQPSGEGSAPRAPRSATPGGRR